MLSELAVLPQKALNSFHELLYTEVHKHYENWTWGQGTESHQKYDSDEMQVISVTVNDLS